MKALFLVGSPFQCLCAFEAVHHYKITDPFFEIVSGDQTERDYQITNLLKRKGFAYHKAKVRHYPPIVARIQNLYRSYIRPSLLRNPVYDYLFIGDYRFGINSALCNLYQIKRGGKAIFLDDGAGTISVIKGLYNPSASVLRIRNHYNRLCARNNIQTNIFFTIFDNLKSDIFTLEKNEFESFHSEISCSQHNAYILGTFTDKYCRHQGIPLNEFLKQFSNICKHLVENVNGEVVFIPHGRDTEQALKQICDEYQVVYRSLDTCVEDYLYENKSNPDIIIGYGSTALYSLKKMYPQATVINILNTGSEKSAAENYKKIAEEYQLLGIHNANTPEEFKEYTNKQNNRL